MKFSLGAKLDGQFFQERKREILFFAAGLVATAFVVFIYADALGFLARSVDEALDMKESPSQPVQFDMAGLRKIGVLRPEHEALVPAPSPQASAGPVQQTPVAGEQALPVSSPDSSSLQNGEAAKSGEGASDLLGF